MKKKIRVGILGATGTIGQNYIALLQNHPWFEVGFLGGSEKKSYAEALGGRWSLPTPLPQNLNVSPLTNISLAKEHCSFVFSALPNSLAIEWEEKYAAQGLPVLSSASAHRMSPDVPLIIPEINSSHLEILPHQKKRRGWEKGFIVAKPNCSIQSFMLPLHVLHHAFKIKKISVTTLQAISGAGITDLPAQLIQDNVIPFITGEEEKVQKEPLKIWGNIKNSSIESLSSLCISAQCNRVPVLEGHLACVSAAFEKRPSAEEILALWKEYTSPFSLPSAPHKPLLYCEEENRPQVRLDCKMEKGMCISVGRLRSCPLLDFRFVALSHNTVRGGAGGGILTAELLHFKGLL